MVTRPPGFSSDPRQEQRAALIALRAGLAPKDWAERSAKAAAHLLGQNIWHKARTVGLYISVRGEIGTEALLLNAWEEEKIVLLPHCSSLPPGDMLFMPCAGKGSLRPGAFGIAEPPLVPGGGSLLPDLVIVPGLAFDQEGRRLGMGGGYYDRFFARAEYSGIPRIGFAFTFQIQEKLVAAPWDIPVHGICTEEGCVWIPPGLESP